MNLLAIETATETCSVALSVDGVIRQRYEHAPRQHAELLLPWVEQMMADAGIGFSALDAIAFSRGPGSFTSLRIGIGVVQGLAWASDTPVVPVSSLAATAQTAVDDGVTSALFALDARMNEVFACTFEANDNKIMVPTSEEKVCDPRDIQLSDDPEMFGIGIGFDRYEALGVLAERLAGVQANIWPKASSVLQLAQEWLKSHEPLTPEQAQPVYLRNNVAKKQSA